MRMSETGLKRGLGLERANRRDKRASLDAWDEAGIVQLTN